MTFILPKAKVGLLLILLNYATHLSCASQSQLLHSRHMESFDEDCTAVIRQMRKGIRSLMCGTPNGMMYEITQADDRFITENFEKGPFVSGETHLIFSSDTSMDKSINAISNSIKELVLKKKVNVPKNRKFATTTGEKSVLVIRVEALDGSTTDNEKDLSNSVFGTYGDPVNLKSQFATCSHDQLNFIPATGTGITDGVTTVSVKVPVSDGDDIMENAITTELINKFRVSNPNEIADHIMYCLPPGTMMGGIAYAYVNYWLSVYSDKWCTYVSAQLHEVGHNLNLDHSNENGEYNDQSGAMSFGFDESDFPERCFNAPKSWQLGWYQNRHKEIDIDSVPAGSVLYSGELAYFNENLSDQNPPMIIKLNRASNDDFYMFFNRKVDFNQGTQEGGNQVLITTQGKEGRDYSPSELLAKLSTGDEWTESSSKILVEVSSIGSRANVKICKEFCFIPIPTGSPTNFPKRAPTYFPSRAPTYFPSRAPSRAPVTPSTCGDNICDVNKGEGCGSCAADCFSPIAHCNAISSLGDGKWYGPQGYGIVFDVQVSRSLYFYEIDVKLMPNVNTQAKVYMKNASHTSDNNLNDWDLVYNGSVNSATTAKLLALKFDSRFYAAANSIVKLYISFSSAGSFIFDDTGDVSNDDIVMKSGNVVLQQLGNTLPDIYYRDYDFVKVVKYDYAAIPTEPPTKNPTDIPTTSPTGPPTISPTESPTTSPTELPTELITESPTTSLTEFPTTSPTESHTAYITEPPTTSPTELPTTSPTELPTTSPTEPPTTSPTKSPTVCEDSPLEFNLKQLISDKVKTCIWVKDKPNLRCGLKGVSKTCPLTCGRCSKCQDSPLLIKFVQDTKTKKKYCSWVADKLSRCNNLIGAKETCRSTCKVCGK